MKITPMRVSLKLVSALAIAGALTACGSSHGPNGPPGTVGGKYDKAVALKDQGQCVEAIPMLQEISERGRGWELAQVHLADCLTSTGRLDEAADWLIKASESNEPRAQARLSLAYLKGEGVPQDRAEAAKWYLLATRSSLNNFVAQSEFPEGFEQKMAAEFSQEDLAAGEALAADWIPTYQGVNAEAVRRGIRDRQKAEQERRKIEDRIRQQQQERARRGR